MNERRRLKIKNLETALSITDKERLATMVDIKDKYLNGTYSLEKAHQLLKEKIGTCTPDEFAYGEQQLKGKYTDEEVTDRMSDLLELFDGILVRTPYDYPSNHPLHAYALEIDAMDKLLDQGLALSKKEFIKNQWLGLFDQFNTWRTHLSRKQNQLYPVLETYGFDRPTKIMWTFDDKARDAIRKAYDKLENDTPTAFLQAFAEMEDIVRDLDSKEREVLLPTSYKMIDDADFITMSRGDHEIGFSLITPPDLYNGNGQAPTPLSDDPSIPQNFANDLQDLLAKYHLSNKSSNTDVLDVATGKLTLEQINLLFKHMPVDLSYVDENELVKFYSDTEHRIFPRSANVIGRQVQNCHPARSVHLVEEIISKFRSGEQDEAEFWINKPEAFIYIKYTAIRDEQGRFRGVLEMMQDCTHIRSLQGSRTLLTWDNERKQDNQGSTTSTSVNASTNTTASTIGKTTKQVKEPLTATNSNESYQIGSMTVTADTKLKEIFSQFDGLKTYMPTINPMFKMLKTPMAIMMLRKATLGMAAERSGMGMTALVKAMNEFVNQK